MNNSWYFRIHCVNRIRSEKRSYESVLCCFDMMLLFTALVIFIETLYVHFIEQKYAINNKRYI